MEYVLVLWPESQNFMEKEWFQDEAVLHPDESSAYFIPKERYEEVIFGPETSIKN